MSAIKLPRRPLGNTGLQVSILGFGASPLGGVFEAIDEDKGVQAVVEAFEAGINFFDTSPFYGATKSETVLGRGLAKLPREQIVVATKVGRYGQDTFDFSAERVTRSVSESLERLQVPYIDIIQCHDMEFGDLNQVINETLPALSKLKAQGLVRHVGITGLPLGIFQHVLDRAEPGLVDCVLSYCHYSLNDTSLSTIIPYLQAKGVGIISASPLSMGLLTNQGPPQWHPAPADVQEACASAAALAKSRGTDISKLALLHALRNPDIATTLVGMATPDMVAVNVRTALEAAGLVQPEGGARQAALEAEVTGEVQGLLAGIQGTTWPSGKPQPGNEA